MYKNVIIKNIDYRKAGKPAIKANKTLKPTDRDNSNVEVEKGEQVVTDLNDDGFPENYTAAGKPHSQGGTPLRLPDDSFVFSKDKSMKIKDPFIQKLFGKSGKTSGFTPAELAKQYDINHYREILANPDSDKLQRNTAEMMIANYNKKLGQLSLVQESMKGFPTGLPHIAMPYITSVNFDPTQLYNTQADPTSMSTPVVKDGGEVNIIVKQAPIYNYANQYGGATKKLQKGGIPTYDPEEKLFLQNLSPDIVLPEDVVESKQGKKKGVYGRFDEKAANDNWAWYGKKIDWNDPKSVGDAQNAYNNRIYTKMKEAGYSDKTANLAVNRIGFVPGKGIPNALDSKAGKYTETRKDFDIAKLQQPAVQATGQVQNQDLPEGLTPAKLDFYKNNPEAAPFWLQDIIATTGAFGDLNNIKKYMPWITVPEFKTATPTFYDPTRELAANAEQANIASQSIGMFAGPQSLNSRLSEVQGRAAENAANILGKYNNLNVGVANQFEQMNTGIKNQASATSAEAANNLYQQNIIANQQFDNAKAQAKQNLRSALINAVTNRGQTQALNSLQEQYRVDPSTGGFVNFMKPKNSFMNIGKPSTQEDMIAQVDKYRKMGWSDELIAQVMGFK